ncbi:hypothetical protein Alches_17380 [Alicyclobacillus hesperidum subsp. aegles]|nr:hypothetical protein Alches_17380 [Alicyclobacillus hesperidum subsp. aegles]
MIRGADRYESVEGFTRKQGHFIAEAKVHSRRQPEAKFILRSTLAGESQSRVSARTNEFSTKVARNTTEAKFGPSEHICRPKAEAV